MRTSGTAQERGRRRGFTLIEMMVVIAIIGIMMSLLFPTIASIRRHLVKTQVKNFVKQIDVALANYRLEEGTLPWSSVHSPAPINRNTVSLVLVTDYLPDLKSKWRDDFDKDGTEELVDLWGYSIKFRADPRTKDPVIWSLGDPDYDARGSARRPGALTDAEWHAILLGPPLPSSPGGDQTADCADDERATYGYDDIAGRDYTDSDTYPGSYYWFGKGDTGNDITNL